MGHRLSVALIVLNAMGFFACLVLMPQTVTKRPKWQYISRAQFSQLPECLLLEPCSLSPLGNFRV
jgi:hypothetical protein